MIVHDILTGISNDIAIAGHLLGTNPVSNLIARHNRIAMVDDRIKKVDERSTGKELKNELEKHEPEIKVDLMYNYIKAKKASMLIESGALDELGDRRIYSSDNAILKRRATDKSTEEDCKIDTVNETSSEVRKEKEEIDKTAGNIIAVGGIILVVVLVAAMSMGTGEGGHSKNLVETVLSILKVIFE